VQKAPPFETVLSISNALDISIDKLAKGIESHVQPSGLDDLSALLGNRSEKEIQLITDIVRAVVKNSVK